MSIDDIGVYTSIDSAVVCQINAIIEYMIDPASDHTVDDLSGLLPLLEEKKTLINLEIAHRLRKYGNGRGQAECLEYPTNGGAA